MLWETLREAAIRRPEAIAFSEGDRDLTWRDLAGRAAAVGVRLTDSGAGPGETVGVLLPNGVCLATTFYGVLAAGAAAAPLPPGARVTEIRRALGPSTCAVVVCERRRQAELTPLFPRVLAVEDLHSGLEAGIPPTSPSPNLDATAFVLFSTGSTGQPKRLHRSHRMLLAEADQLHRAIRLGPGDRILGIPPLFHSYGICCVLLGVVRSGARAHLFAEFDPEAILARAARERATVIYGTPFHFSVLARLRRRAGSGLEALRWAVSCGAAAPANVIRGFHARFGIAIRQLYGASEVGSVTLNTADDPLLFEASAGTPLPGVEVRIVGAESEAPGGGAVGEIAVRSPAGSIRYEDLPEMTTACFRDGWFFSGDLGRIDASGNLYITGRAKLVINVGGNKIDPAEVEAVLEDHPAVAEAAVVGIAGDHGLEMVKTAIVLRSPAGADEIQAHCAARLSSFKVPRIVEFRDSLPRSASGKLLRKDLLEPKTEE